MNYYIIIRECVTERWDTLRKDFLFFAWLQGESRVYIYVPFFKHKYLICRLVFPFGNTSMHKIVRGILGAFSFEPAAATLELVMKNLEGRSSGHWWHLQMSSLFRRLQMMRRLLHHPCLPLLLVPMHAYVVYCVFGGQFIISFVICVPAYDVGIQNSNLQYRY